MSIRTELILLFFIALGLSMVLTPAARAFGTRFGALDMPAERKVHTKPIPRIGGLAVFLAFMFTCCIGQRLFANAGYLYHYNFNTAMGHAGAILILLCGLFDDFRRLNTWIKLFLQIAAGTFAFIGGAAITNFFVAGFGIAFSPFFSYIVTVLWFLLYAGFAEGIQYLIPYRSFNISDMLSNMLGLSAGFCIFVPLRTSER